MSLEIDGLVIATPEFREHAGADGRGASSSELVLKPGDGLYVPMWMPHWARASDQGSIQLAVAVRPPRTQDALDWSLVLFDAATCHPVLAAIWSPSGCVPGSAMVTGMPLAIGPMTTSRGLGAPS